MNLKFSHFQTRTAQGAFRGSGPPENGSGGPPMSRPKQKTAREKRMYAPGGRSAPKRLEGCGRKQTNSLIGAEKTACLFSDFTEKRKNAGLSLKSCAEYTKINGKFNRGFHGSPARSPTQNRSGARAGPCAPFWLPQKGSTLHYSHQKRSSLFPDSRGLFEQSAKAPRPPRVGAWFTVDSRRSPFQQGRPEGGYG